MSPFPTRSLPLALTLCLFACGDDAVPNDAAPGADATTDSRLLPDATDPIDGTTTDTSNDTGDASVPRDGTAADDASTPPGPTLLVASGTAGRTTISCDGGATWVADRSLDREGHSSFCGMTQDVRCHMGACAYLSTFDDDACRMDDGCDCSHSPANARSLTYANGWFIQKVGWFGPAPIMRSRDGVVWEALDNVSSQSAGVTRVGSRLVLTTFDGAHWSDDDGESWSRTEFDNQGHARTLVTVPVNGADGPSEVAISLHDSVMRITDGTEGWRTPETMADGCGDQPISVLSNGNTWVVPHRGGFVCVSDDGGRTFDRVAYGGEHAPEGWIHDGTYFWLWEWRYGHRSRDGRTWERTDTEVEGRVGRTVQDPTSGMLISWYNQYDAQRVSRSTDGIHWESLPSESFDQGQRITHIVAGTAPTGFACPSR